MKILISVIIPVYNVAQYLEQCLDSVIRQSYTNLEIIIVDDGSTDESGDICDRYAAMDTRVVVIHKTNGGVSDARNVGIERATGEYISFIDSDDYVSAVFVETLLKNIQNTGADIASVKTTVQFKDDLVVEGTMLNETKVSVSLSSDTVERSLIQIFYQLIPSGVATKMYKANLFNDLRFLTGCHLGEDAMVTYKAFLRAHKIVIVESDLYACRQRADSLQRRSFDERKMVCLTVANSLIEDLKPYGKTLHIAAIARGYAMVYSVFLQIPNSNWIHKIELWNWMKKYRRQVLFDRNPAARKKNQFGAFVSYLGMDTAYFIGRKLGQSIHK